MYKVMIVDDEWLVQEGIKVTLESNFNDINIVGMASSGRQAIEMSQDLNPDIIFMDIKMPGIDGIEAIEAIKQRLKSVKFVVVSAYEQFSYAKKAVELGVSHYILKPIHQEKLIEVVKGILRDLKEEQFRRDQRIANKEKLEKALPILENGFVYSMLMNTDFKSEITKYKDLFEIKKDYAFVCVVEIGNSEEASLLTEIQSNDLYPKIQNMVKYKCKSVIGPMIINRITLVILDQDFEYEYEQRLHAMDLVSSIQERMDDLTDLPVKIGIGSSCLLEKIKVSLDEANYTLSRIKESGSLHYNDVFESEDPQGYSYIEIKDDQQAIISAMENGNVDLLMSLLNSFFIRLKEKYHQDLIGLRHHITELMVMVMSASYRNSLPENEAGYGTYLNEMKRYESVISLENWATRKIERISGLIQNKKTNHISKVILEAKEFIDLHYKEDLSLNDVSKEVAISPQYFSSIFKEEMGMSYVEYLRSKRIDVAKELLRENKYSVKEICYEIGYNDPNYFSRLFKRIVGVSPTEFK